MDNPDFGNGREARALLENTTYIATYGKICGIVIVLIVAGVLIKVLHDMRKISVAGRVIVSGCITILALELLVVVMENLMILPFSDFSVFVPFFSQSWQSVMLSYVLMGCIMSVYRYERVETENNLNKEGDHEVMKTKNKAEQSQI